MKLLTAAFLLLGACIQVFAQDNGNHGIPETVMLKNPGMTSRHSVRISRGANYAVSAKVSSSASRTALIEIRLFSGDKQCRYLRSVHSSDRESVLENVFNAGNADRAEIAFHLIDDAMPGTSAQFKDIRFVVCNNSFVHSWNHKAPVNCRREFRDEGRTVILTPTKKSSGYCSSGFSKIPKNSRLRFSARVRSERPGMACLAVNCGAKNERSRYFKSPWNTKTNEILTIEFDVANAEWVSTVLRCTGVKKFRGPVEFSEIKFELIPPETPEKTVDKSVKKGNPAK